MALPVLETWTGGAYATAGSVGYPSGISDGDLAILIVDDNNASYTPPASPSWTSLSVSGRRRIYYRYFSSGDSTTLNTLSGPASWIGLRISNATGAPAVGTAGGTANPPASATLDSAKDYLAVAAIGGDGKGNSFTYPSNMTGIGQYATSNDGPSANGSVATAEADVTGSTSFDPNTFGGDAPDWSITITAQGAGPTTGSFTADAVIEASQSATFAADAVIEKEQTSSFTADAEFWGTDADYWDDFDRTVSNGLGTSSDGNTWGGTGGTNYDVTPRYVYSTLNNQLTSSNAVTLDHTTVDNTKFRTLMGFSRSPTVSSHSLAFCVKHDGEQTGATYYRCNIRFTASNAVDSRLDGNDAGSFVDLDGGSAWENVGTWSDLSTEKWWVEVIATNSSPTLFEVRVWKDGNSRPATASQTGYDSSRNAHGTSGVTGFFWAVYDTVDTDLRLHQWEVWDLGQRDFTADAVIEKEQTGTFTADAEIAALVVTFTADAVIVDEYDAQILSESSLEAYLPFNEASGASTAYDYSGNSHDGTPWVDTSGSYTFGQTGLPNLNSTSIRLANGGVTGEGAAVDLAGTFALGDGPMTYELWFKRANTTQTFWQAFINQDFDGTPGSGLALNKSPKAVEFFRRSAATDANTNTGIDDATVWHHAVMTKSATDEWLVYLDGTDDTETGATTESTISDNATVVIGSWTPSPSGFNFLDAWVAKVAIYSRVLTPADVWTHWELGVGSRSFTADAYIAGATAGDFTADAVIEKSISASFTADAVIKVTQTFTAAAQRLGPTFQYRLGEVSGSTTAVDETGNHDGTYTNSPILGDPGWAENTAMTGDVTGDFMAVTDHVDFEWGTGDYTYVAAVKLPATWDTADWQAFFAKGPGTEYLIGTRSTEGDLGMYVVDTGYTITPTTDLQDGNWHLLMWTIDRSGSLSLYVDGGTTPEATDDISGQSAVDVSGANDFRVGTGSGTTYAYEGSIQHVIGWKGTLLTGSQFAELYGYRNAFTADAVVERTQSASFTADAVIKKAQSGSVTVDAVIGAAVPQLVCGAECGIDVGVAGSTHWDLRNAGNDSTPRVDNTVIRSGSYAYKFQASTSSILGKRDFPNTPFPYGRFYFRVPDATPTANPRFGMWAVAGASGRLYFQIQTDGTLRAVIRGDDGVTETFSSTNNISLSADTWYGVEWSGDTSGTTWTLKWRTWTEAGGWTTSETVSQGSNSNQPDTDNYIGLYTGTETDFVAYIDDIAMGRGTVADQFYDATGTNGASGRVLRLDPASDGTHASFTTGDFTDAGGNIASTDTDVWQNLDTVDMTASTDYVESETGATTSEYIEVHFENASTVYDNPRGVNVVAVWDAASGSPTPGDLDISDDGSTWTTTASPGSVTAGTNEYHSTSIPAVPSTAAAWTRDDIDALRARFYGNGATGANARLEGLALEVEWTREPASFTADAVITATVAASTTADAIVLVPQSGAVAADAVVERTTEAAFFTDAILSRLVQAGVTADAVIEAPVVGSTDADAIVLSASAQAFTVDAAINVVRTFGLSADAVLFATQVGAATADAIFLKATSGDFLADALLQATQNGQFVAQAVIERTAEDGFSADAIVRRGQTGQFNVDAIVEEQATGNFLVDAWLEIPTFSGDFATDAIIHRAQTASFLTDAWVEGQGLAAFAVDAVVFANVAQSTQLDATVLVGQAGQFTLEATVLAQVDGNWSADATLLGSVSQSFDAAATLRAETPGSFTLDVVVAKVFAGSYVLSAVVEAPLSGSAQADAAIRRVQADTSLADAVIRRTQAGSFVADATLLAVQTETFQVDAWVDIPSFTFDFATDAIIHREQTSSFLTAAWVEGAGVGAFTADAVVFATATGSFPTDAVVLVPTTNAFTADSIVERLQSGTLQVDAVVLSAVEDALSSDAVVIGGQSATFQADAVFTVLQSASTQLFADILKQQAGAFTADAEIVAGTQTASFLTDAIVLATQTASTTADAWVAGSGIGAFAADAVLLASQSGSTSVDAVVQGTESGSLAVEATVLGLAQGTLSVDAIVLASQSASTTTDAIVLAGTAGAFTADAVTVREQSGSFSAAAWVEGAGVGAFTADAVVLGTASDTIAVSAVVAKTTSGTFSAASLLKTVSQASLTADAVLEATRTGGFGADAVLLSPQTGGFSTDANISLLVGGGSFPLGAVLERPTSGAFAADALFLTSASGSFTADAQFSSVAVGAFTADANITGAGQAVFSVDAAIAGTTQGAGTIDASITRLIPQEIEATFSAAIIAGTTAATTIEAGYTVSLTFVQGDTAPDIIAVIHEEDDETSLVDLTGASVRFQMRERQGKRYRINSLASITDAVNGAVSYSWGANDLAQHGTFIVQWEVTYPGGRIQTTSPEVEITVRRQ